MAGPQLLLIHRTVPRLGLTSLAAVLGFSETARSLGSALSLDQREVRLKDLTQAAAAVLGSHHGSNKALP